MRLTTKGRFAVTAMIDLAMRQHQGPVTLAGISQRQKISLSYLEQLFGKLRRHELVESTRGPGGGYTLAPLLRTIIAGTGLRVQTGGGVRSRDDVAELLDAGASRVVVGSLAVRQPELVEAWLEEFGADRVTIALDTRRDAHGVWRLPVHGWTETGGETLGALALRYAQAGLVHLLSTDIDRDGMLAGPNPALYAHLRGLASSLSVQASGGVHRLDDIGDARAQGCAGIVLGRALLEGRFNEAARTVQVVTRLRPDDPALATLKGKVDAILAKVPADKRQQLGELLDSDSKLKDAFIENPKLVDGWLLVSDHPKISRNLNALETVTELAGDSDFIGKLPGGKDDLKNIIDAMKNPLEGTENHKLVDFQKHLKNVSDITKRHSDVQGFNRLLTDLKNGNYSMQDGVTHMMEQMAKIDSGKVKKIDYEFEGDGVECVKCRYDLIVEIDRREVKVEYKSWSAGNISKISSKQFTEYFRSSKSMDDFQYVFNKSKTPDVTVVKKEMKKVFDKNFDSIFDAMNEEMKGSLGLFDDPDIPAKDAFRALVENTDSDLYKFIKIE